MVNPPGPTFGRGDASLKRCSSECNEKNTSETFRNTVKFNVFLHVVMLRVERCSLLLQRTCKKQKRIPFWIWALLMTHTHTHTHTPSVGYMTSTIAKPARESNNAWFWYQKGTTCIICSKIQRFCTKHASIYFTTRIVILNAHKTCTYR